MKSEGLSLIVKNITRLLSAFILLYGIYVVLYGHVSPGGGFTGGVILAAGLLFTSFWLVLLRCEVEPLDPSDGRA